VRHASTLIFTAPFLNCHLSGWCSEWKQPRTRKSRRHRLQATVAICAAYMGLFRYAGSIVTLPALFACCGFIGMANSTVAASGVRRLFRSAPDSGADIRSPPAAAQLPINPCLVAKRGGWRCVGCWSGLHAATFDAGESRRRANHARSATCEGWM
jgi:hypothetical protein